jgi:hypothetical protein
LRGLAKLGVQLLIRSCHLRRDFAVDGALAVALAAHAIIGETLIGHALPAIEHALVEQAEERPDEKHVNSALPYHRRLRVSGLACEIGRASAATRACTDN